MSLLLEFHIFSSIWKSRLSTGTTVFQWLPRDISEILKGLEVNRQDSMDQNLNRLIKFSNFLRSLQMLEHVKP